RRWWCSTTSRTSSGRAVRHCCGPCSPTTPEWSCWPPMSRNSWSTGSTYGSWTRSRTGPVASWRRGTPGPPPPVGPSAGKGLHERPQASPSVVGRGRHEPVFGRLAVHPDHPVTGVDLTVHDDTFTLGLSVTSGATVDVPHRRPGGGIGQRHRVEPILSWCS